MATYDHKQVLNDYEKGKITPEMAVGHSLQHIGKLYEALATVTASQREWQPQFAALDQRVTTMQTAVDRLTAFMEKVLRKSKRNPPTDQQHK